MILKEYFNILDKDAVLDAVEELYPDSHRESYSGAWDELCTLEPKADPDTADMIICATHVYHEYEYDARYGDMEPDDYISIHGERESAYDDTWDEVRKGREISWAIEHTAWTEWLAWEVENNVPKEDPRCDTDTKLLANILWEMTFCAYTNEEVGCEMEIIKERMAEVEKWEAEGTLEDHCVEVTPESMDEMMELLKKEDDDGC